MPGVGTLAYDARNRITGTGGVPTRGYDPGNRKIWWKDSNGITFVDYWLPNGEKLVTYKVDESPYYSNQSYTGPVQFSTISRYLHFAGRQVKVEGRYGVGGYVEWPQPDRLSSNTRHHPYGEERGTSSTEYKFATYQRESSGLDYALNRYYSSVYGRFLSSDPYRASGGPRDPGSWNRYVYVQGDPVNAVDPSGLAKCDAVSFSRGYGGATAEIWCWSDGGTVIRNGRIDVPWGDPKDPAYYAYVVGVALATLGVEVDREERSQKRVPHSVRFLSAARLGKEDQGDCSGQPFGTLTQLTFQLLDQSGDPFAVADLEVQERVTNEYTVTSDGRYQTNPDSGWVTLIRGGVSLTTPTGSFYDRPFGGCGPGPAQHGGTQAFRVNYGNTWYTLNQHNFAMDLLPSQNISFSSTMGWNWRSN